MTIIYIILLQIGWGFAERIRGPDDFFWSLVYIYPFNLVFLSHSNLKCNAWFMDYFLIFSFGTDLVQKDFPLEMLVRLVKFSMMFRENNYFYVCLHDPFK